jgi:hypothetical protein
MRKPLMVIAAAVMTAIGFTAPAQATVTDVNMPFGMAYGNSTTVGSVHFTNGYSASVSGTLHAGSGKRYVCAFGTNGSQSTGYRCSQWVYADGSTQPLNLTSLSIPLPGGVQRVYILMRDGNERTVAQEFCTRNGCTREF